MSAVARASFDDDAPLWTRQPYDTDKSWPIFQIYRDAHPADRGAERIAERTNTPVRTIKNWRLEHQWAMRASAYDAYLDQAKVRKRVEEIELMEERHAQIAAAGLAALTLPIAALGRPRVVGTGDTQRHVPRLEDLERMPTDQLVRLAARAGTALARLVGVERLSRGEATQIVAGSVTHAGMPAPELEGDEARLRAIFAALEESGQVGAVTLELGHVIEDAEIVAEDGG